MAANSTFEDGMQQRRQGLAFALKEYHNLVKKKLINEAAVVCKRRGHSMISLLDVGCGRACDLFKWYGAGINYALGIDGSSTIISEAHRRLNDSFVRRYGRGRYRSGESTPVDFLHYDSFGNDTSFNITSLSHRVKHKNLLDRVTRHGGFSIVTMMFSLHYFFASEDMAKNTFASIASALRPGGLAVLIFPDGERVQDLVSQGEDFTKGEFSNGFMTIRKRWISPKPYGSAYEFEILDTITEFTESRNGTTGNVEDRPLEYLVDFQVLRTIAKKFGLEPRHKFVDRRLDHLFEIVEIDSDFKHFNPPYRSSNTPLAEASKVYAAIIFEKAVEDQ
mmetsp:Transcript_15529/g.23452  ORF Transcript_15529/g.23452 Transcript_15529/m.23452 type:complete len:334 (-) Transcript_15529:73-1074(-)